MQFVYDTFILLLGPIVDVAVVVIYVLFPALDERRLLVMWHHCGRDHSLLLQSWLPQCFRKEYTKMFCVKILIVAKTLNFKVSYNCCLNYSYLRTQITQQHVRIYLTIYLWQHTPTQPRISLWQIEQSQSAV